MLSNKPRAVLPDPLCYPTSSTDLRYPDYLRSVALGGNVRPSASAPTWGRRLFSFRNTSQSPRTNRYMIPTEQTALRGRLRLRRIAEVVSNSTILGLDGHGFPPSPVANRPRYRCHSSIPSPARPAESRISYSRSQLARHRSFTIMAPLRLQTMSTVLVEDGIAMLKFNRPDNANALGAQVMHDLLQALSWALDDTQVKVVILSGEGKFFCAGKDLVDVPEHGPVLSDEAVEVLR